MTTSQRLSPRTLLCSSFVLIAAGASLGGCFASPDTEERLDDYRAAAINVTPDVTDTDTDGSGDGSGEMSPFGVPYPEETPTIEGTMFFALSANLGRTKPLFMEFSFEPGDEPGTLNVSAQPLAHDTLDTAGTIDPNRRTVVGDPLPTTVATVDDRGVFHVEFTNVTVVGAANPLTFRDIGGTLILDGIFVNGQYACGKMGGEVTSPTTVNLNGSFFNAAAVDPSTYLDLNLSPFDCTFDYSTLEE